MLEGALKHIYAWHLNQVVLWGHMKNKIHISTCRRRIDTIPGKVCANLVQEARKHNLFTKRPTWGHMTVWKIHISAFTKIMSNKLCRLLTLDIQHANALSRHQLPVTTKKNTICKKKNQKEGVPWQFFMVWKLISYGPQLWDDKTGEFENSKSSWELSRIWAWHVIGYWTSLKNTNPSTTISPWIAPSNKSPPKGQTQTPFYSNWTTVRLEAKKHENLNLIPKFIH